MISETWKAHGRNNTMRHPELSDFQGGATDVAPQSGFFPLPTRHQCKHPEHEPPTHLVIPEGHGYRHVCPSCGMQRTLIPPQISY